MSVGLLSERLTRSRLIGGITMGIGMALFERTRIDHKSARIMSADLADYLIPTNADIGEIDANFIGREDPIANPIGTKPVGEIGICGTAAAMANAVLTRPESPEVAGWCAAHEREPHRRI